MEEKFKYFWIELLKYDARKVTLESHVDCDDGDRDIEARAMRPEHRHM
jgi:hypothetical protein